jgi:LuxR family maltose regulon positive regulatory protein
VPAGSRLVLAGRAEPPLRIARLRAEGKVAEIGPGDLALTREDASALLRAAGVVLGEDEVAALDRRAEGWAAGLYLAALYLREGGPLASALSFGGADRLVSEYVESEFLERTSQPQRVFLTRTAVLARMCGPLCEAVLDLAGSGPVLADLARSNFLLVPLDRRGEWYRYHHLLRDMMLDELRRQEPGLMPVLRRRAADWCRENKLPEEALEYSMAAGDVEAVARLVEMLALPAYRRGRVRTVQRWFQWLEDRGAIDGHPMVAVLASVLSAMTGRPGEAEHWADAADRWQDQNPARPEDAQVRAWAALARATLCRHGVGQMRADADQAARVLAAVGYATPAPALFQGVARVLSGDLDSGDAFLERALGVGEGSGAPEDFAVALAERSLVAMARGDWGQAEIWAGQAGGVLRRARFEDSCTMPLVCAVQARVAVHRGDVPGARQQLASAQRQRPLLTYALPHLAGQARIELIRVHLALADLAGARMLMAEVDELLRRRPDLGTLPGQAEKLRARLATERGSSVLGASALTAAELRLLPMLTTHLSYPEIGAQMYLSRHTIKAQATSIYRKLGADSRSRAVTQARKLGLLDG